MRALTLLTIVGLAATAGCSKRDERPLPPPPPQAAAADAGAATPATGAGAPMASESGAVPGSRDDFMRQVSADRVLFAYDSYELDDQARGVLDSQAKWLTQYPQVRLTIEGHADERGTREYNLALGERRATAVRNYLAAQGVDAGRIETISYGKERPEAAGSDESAWAQNRRAVTVLGAGVAS